MRQSPQGNYACCGNPPTGAPDTGRTGWLEKPTRISGLRPRLRVVTRHEDEHYPLIEVASQDGRDVPMGKGRLEMFSDGVIAIILTVMVLELHAPEEETPEALRALVPALVSYVLSFIVLGIYWNNHHQYLHGVERVDGSVMWANLHLLFWLSLVPFVTGWMGEHSFARFPVVMYGIVLTGAGCAFLILQTRLVAVNGPDSAIARALHRDRKAALSIALWIGGVIVALFAPRVAVVVYALIVALWLIPDRRVERVRASPSP
jgi:uncharacterized membrane protein